MHAAGLLELAFPTHETAATSAATVLLIEDNPGDARYIRELLAEGAAGTFNLDYADRLSIGLERLRAPGVDVVLLDLLLPDSAGLETFRTVHAAAREMPIVVLSGSTMKHSHSKQCTKAPRITSSRVKRTVRCYVECCVMQSSAAGYLPPNTPPGPRRSRPGARLRPRD